MRDDPLREPVRKELVGEIDRHIRSWSPQALDGERKRFFEIVLSWLQEWVADGQDWSHELDTHECDDPGRYLITLDGEPGYVVSIHDLMGGGVGGAESVTGADYSVQHPVAGGEEKFLFVQAKRDEYLVKPKQYFAFGGFYMYLQYILNENWLWDTRFSQEQEYVTRRETPHQEALFVSIHFDADKVVYVPLSSVLRTFEKSTYQVDDQLSGKERIWVTKHTGVLAEFSDTDQHLSPPFTSFDAFYQAAERCDIGLTHPADIGVTEKKLDRLLDIAAMVMRPNVNIIETAPADIPEYVNSLS